MIPASASACAYLIQYETDSAIAPPSFQSTGVDTAVVAGPIKLVIFCHVSVRSNVSQWPASSIWSISYRIEQYFVSRKAVNSWTSSICIGLSFHPWIKRMGDFDSHMKLRTDNASYAAREEARSPYRFARFTAQDWRMARTSGSSFLRRISHVCAISIGQGPFTIIPSFACRLFILSAMYPPRECQRMCIFPISTFWNFFAFFSVRNTASDSSKSSPITTFVSLYATLMRKRSEK